MIVGTAGHVDHGKTTLVRALTGVDTDRLKEEKARGLTIDLGYAYLELPGRDMLGIVDVPGHERFVHTMVAGAAGIDHALLVVAADDGVMPQTREHLAILELLGVSGATVALTKVDRVSPQRLAEAHGEVAALLAGTALAGAPVFETAATRPGDPGVQALLARLSAVARLRAPRPAQAGFRLAVDRVFSLPGAGTVVTGTIFCGTVAVGDPLQASGSRAELRVRSLHALNRPAGRAAAGERCALALAGLARDEAQRGDWIVAPQALHPTPRVDVRLRLLPGAGPLRAWAPVHAHLGTGHHTAHVVPLEGEEAGPGESSRVQLVFERPVLAWPGDRLVLRNPQATRTLGGGIVLDPFAPARHRRSAARQAWLDALEVTRGGAPVGTLLDATAGGLRRSRLALYLGAPAGELPGAAAVRALPLAAGDALWLSEAAWEAACARVLETLGRFHEANPDAPGPNAAQLQRLAFPGPGSTEQGALWLALVAELRRAGRLASRGPWLHLPGHAVTLSPAEEALAARLLPWLADGGFDPPWVRELAVRAPAPEERVRALLLKLALLGQVFQVVKDLFYAPGPIEALARQVRALASAGPDQAVRAADFRDATGLGRKRAIQVLEFFDHAGLTRRQRDEHVLRPGSPWDGPA